MKERTKSNWLCHVVARSRMNSAIGDFSNNMADTLVLPSHQTATQFYRMQVNHGYLLPWTLSNLV